MRLTGVMCSRPSRLLCRQSSITSTMGRGNLGSRNDSGRYDEMDTRYMHILFLSVCVFNVDVFVHPQVTAVQSPDPSITHCQHSNQQQRPQPHIWNGRTNGCAPTTHCNATHDTSCNARPGPASHLCQSSSSLLTSMRADLLLQLKKTSCSRGLLFSITLLLKLSFH